MFVTYKKAYTPAIANNSTDIPGEWFYYIAYGTYADFLRGEGQQEKAALADAGFTPSGELRLLVREVRGRVRAQGLLPAVG